MRTDKLSKDLGHREPFPAKWEASEWPGRARIVFVLLLSALPLGCGRSNYRQRADREAERLVQEKNCPKWALTDLNVYSDPRSRLYDPFDPDHPPKPIDDPCSNAIMERNYGPKGMRRWTKDGVTSTRANPMWEALLPTYVQTTPDGRVVLDLSTINTLARIHNRDYQTNLEEIYLSALDVAFERFRFDVQFFGGNTTLFSTNGNEATAELGRTRQGPPRNSQSILDTTSALGFTKRFATGAELLVGIANSVVWQFSGEDTNFTTSAINYSLVQPVLRAGGKVVVLETLTRSERNLLANLRAQAQFRQDFYKNLAFGGQETVEPQRIGGFEGGAGLTGFTGTGTGGFGGVGAGQGFGGLGTGGGVGGSGAGAATGLAGGGEGILEGFYGLLQRLQTIRNTELSLSQQELTLGLLEANFEAGLIDLVQVDEFRQNIETERANLIRSRTAYQDQIEQYLIQRISLPPDLPVELDDAYIRPFQLIDPQVTGLQNEATDVVRQIGDLPEEPTVESLRTILKLLRDLWQRADVVLDDVAREHTDLVRKRAELLAKLHTDGEREEFTSSLRTVEDGLPLLETRLNSVREDIEALAQEVERGSTADAINLLSEVVRGVSGTLQEIGLLQARTRMQAITVVPVHLGYDDAVRIARANRLDWMNQRAAVVDQWRLVAFNANRLLAGLDIVIDGDLGTIGDSATRFRGTTNNTRARIIFDAPLNRKGERNLYRESLIDYQRAKRRYVRYVDLVTLSLRSRLRQIERLAENLEIQRRALSIAIRRVDQTLEDLNRPFPPVLPGEAPQQLGPTAAQNLLRALSDFRNTQDNFMSVWLNYEAARVNLQFELGIIQIGADGAILDVSIEEAIDHCVPIGPTEEEEVPIEACLDEIDGAVAIVGDATSALSMDPDPKLLSTVDAALWDDPDAERRKIADEAANEPATQETDNFAPEKDTLWDTVAMKLGWKASTAPPFDKSLYPKSLRQFRELEEQGVDDEGMRAQTGWSPAAIRAFREASRVSQRPIIETIPVAPASQVLTALKDPQPIQGSLSSAETKLPVLNRAKETPSTPVAKNENPTEADAGVEPQPMPATRNGSQRGWIR